MLQACKALVAGLTWIGPLPGVTAQVTLQVRLPLYSVSTKGAFEAHNWIGICNGEKKRLNFLAFLFY